MALQMFLWENLAYLLRVSKDDAEHGRLFIANQGLADGFLAAGLALALLNHDPIFKLFFLVSMLSVGIFKSITISLRFSLAQALPALLAILLALNSKALQNHPWNRHSTIAVVGSCLGSFCLAWVMAIFAAVDREKKQHQQ